MVKQPNIVLFMTDEQRFDWVGSASDGFFETPFLDELAASGVRFASAYSSSTTCVPSRVSLLTGLHHSRVPTVEGSLAMQQGLDDRPWPARCGLRDGVDRSHALHADACRPRLRHAPDLREHQPRQRLRTDDIDDYARWMAAQGLPDWRVWDRRSDGEIAPHVAGTPASSPPTPPTIPTGWIESEAVNFLRSRRSDRPLFLVVSFPHPHAPYDPPEPYASMYEPDDVEVPADGFDVNESVLADFGKSWDIFSEFTTPAPRGRSRGRRRLPQDPHGHPGDGSPHRRRARPRRR